MTKNEINEIVENQRKYFLTHETHNVKVRVNHLKKLRKIIKENEK